MNICYLANVRMPTEKAHGVQIMKMCEAFAQEGHTLYLLTTARKSPIRENAFQYYDVSPSFFVQKLWVPDTVARGKVGFVFESVFFGIRGVFSRAVWRADVIFGRDELPLFLVSLLTRKKLIWESHTGAWGWAARRLAHRASYVVVISQGLADFYEAKGIAKEKIIVAHDGVDLAQFAHPEEKEVSRRRLGLPLDIKIVMYIGRLDGWKGVLTLCNASAQLYARNPAALIVIIGGEDAQISVMQKEYPHILFLGFRPYREIADNQAAADVLVLPNTGLSEVSQSFTSPLKLFTYLASGRPVVCSDLPSIREVVDETCVEFCPPDDPEALARAVTKVLADEAHAHSLVIAATQRVRQYTWSARASAILGHIV